ncbi:transmembrane protease serine 6-like isoform X2 [Paramacrobiotus metropolitanus]|nr:transmembrane protease serine 6-like isoform X2 [Paramacrobiotus metropolitanus]
MLNTIALNVHFSLDSVILIYIVLLRFSAVLTDEFPSNIPQANVILLTSSNPVKNLQSPNYPKAYSSRSSTSYWISGGGSPIRIRSKQFSLNPANKGQCDADRLTFWDAKYPYFSLGTFCGAVTLDVLSYSDNVAVAFTANSPRDYSGFDLEVSRSQCGKADFLCPSKKDKCIPSDAVCNGVADCPQKEDEICSLDCGIPQTPIGPVQQANNDRIIGGTQVKSRSWPWQVRMQFKQFICGGSLVAPQWIVSAAHCCFEDKEKYRPEDITVQLKPELCGSSQSIRVEVKEVIPHPDYKGEPANEYDYCLLVLKAPIQFSDDLKPVCLPRANDIAQISQGCFTAGCGSTLQYNADVSKPPSQISKLLLQIPLSIVEKSTCSRSIAISPETICAYTPGKDSCQGDSGGPLICPRQDNPNSTQWVLHGVTSVGL